MAQRNTAGFPASRPRAKKRHAGATDAERTPLAIRAKGVTISDEMDGDIRKRVAAKLGKFAEHIERVTIRFEDVNGPRGGIDVVCRGKVVLSGLPSVVVEERAKSARLAFGQVLEGLTRAVRKVLERASRSGKGGRSKRSAPASARTRTDAPADAGSIIGRRVGRADANLELALDRPEKRRRDQPVDTSAAGVSASDRKAGYGSTARRNTKAKTPRATATLEDSRTRPSRKSTRKSANRAKSATNIRKKAVAKATSPAARAARSRR